MREKKQVHDGYQGRVHVWPHNEYLLLVTFGGHIKIWGTNSELQKVGILVPRIPDICGGKSGHFQIVAPNVCIIGIKRLQNRWLMTHFNSKWIQLRRK